MALRCVAAESSNCDFELASFTTGDDKISPTQAIYTFHYIDGHTSYRITLRRFHWQNRTAASQKDRIWSQCAAKKLPVSRSTEDCANGFHKTKRQKPSTDQPGGPDHAARRLFHNGRFS
jgi:hypothetical protein